MSKFLFVFIVFWFACTGVASADNCAASNIDSDVGLHQAEATSFAFQFDSGASWALCWHIDEHAGLVISRVFYAAPSSEPRQVLDSLSVGQILFKYDEDVQAEYLLSESGLGATLPQSRDSHPEECAGGEHIVGVGGYQICQRYQQLNHLTKVRRIAPVMRHEISLHAQSQIGTHFYRQIYRLTEDGEISPVVVFSGRINRFTNDPRYGIKLKGVENYAASATLLVNWRLDFNINGTPANDLVDEIEFTPSANNDGSRNISFNQLQIETARDIHSENFRGWRISDSTYSSGQSGVATGSADTRLGYYLDPQGSGYGYASDTDQWSGFDFSVTAKRNCEKLAAENDRVNEDCAASLDAFVSGESLSNVDTVVWYSMARHFTPQMQDYPAISALPIGFKILPFDWSARSMFGSAAEQGEIQ